MIIDNVQNLRNAILQRRSIATGVGTVVGDTIIGPVAQELDRVDTLTELNTRMQSLNSLVGIESDTAFFNSAVQALNTTPDQLTLGISLFLNSIAGQYGLTRKPATYATGFVTFGRTNAPTADITINAGMTVSSSTTGQQFQVTAPGTLSATSPNYDTSLGLYDITLPVAALTLGAAGNIDAQLIDTSSVSLSGISFIQNTASITNGVDQESDADLAARVQSALQANNYGTAAGYKGIILQNTSVTDAYIAGAQDPFMKRDLGDGGSIDIYLLEQNLVQVSEIGPISDTIHILAQQPVAGVQSVQGLQPGNSYTFVPDTTSVYAGSVKALNKLIFTIAPLVPYTVYYTIDQNVLNTQNLINTNPFIGADVLVKQGIELPVDIFMTIRVANGYSVTTVTAAAITNVTQTVDALKLGQNLDLSTIVAVVQDTPGVLQVLVEAINKFNLTSSTGVVDTIVANGNEYIRLNLCTVGVTA